MTPTRTTDTLAYFQEYTDASRNLEQHHMSDDSGRDDAKYNLDWREWHERAGIVEGDWVKVEAARRMREGG